MKGEAMEAGSYRQRDLAWRGDDLCIWGKGEPVVSIVPDERYPQMWRVQYPDGRLTGMVNLTRARDAARGIALLILNPPRSPA
jgi:hypothetical protein